MQGIPKYYRLVELQDHFRKNVGNLPEQINRDFLLYPPLATNYSMKNSFVFGVEKTFHMSGTSLLQHLELGVPGTMAEEALILLNHEQQVYMLLV